MKNYMYFVVSALLLCAFSARGFEVAFRMGSASEASLKIGTGDECSDVWDEKDLFYPPMGPGVMNYMYFRGSNPIEYEFGKTGRSEIEGYEKLCEDYKSSGSASLSWCLVVESTEEGGVELKWTSPEIAPGASLVMRDSSGKEVADLVADSSCVLSVGTYFIDYAALDAPPAPACPAVKELDFVSFGGNVIKTELDFDAEKFTISGIRVIYFSDDEEPVCIEQPDGASEPSFDPSSKILSLEVPAGCNDLNIYYTLEVKEGNGGIARGMVKAYASGKPVLKLISADNVSAEFANGSEDAYKPFVVKYRAEYASEMDIAEPDFSIVMPPMDAGVYEVGKFWSAAAKINGGDTLVLTAEAVNANDGSTRKQDRFILDYGANVVNYADIEITVTPKIVNGLSASSGDITAEINCAASGETEGDEGFYTVAAKSVRVRLPGDGAPVIVDGSKSDCNDIYTESANVTEKVEFVVMFKDNDDGTEPSGIAAVELLGKIGDRDIPAGLLKWSTSDLPVTGSKTVKLQAELALAPELLDGAERSETESVKISARVTDGEENAVELSLWTFELRDLDRAPSVPASISSEGRIFTDGYAGFTVMASGAVDEDGDVVRYRYEFSSGDRDFGSVIAASGEVCGLPGEVDLRRGETLTVKAYSLSMPAYLDGVPGAENSTPKELNVVVSNTPPAFVELKKNEISLKEYGAAGENAAYGESEYSCEVSELAVFTDVDADAGKDELEYSIVNCNVPSDVAELTVSDGVLKIALNSHAVLPQGATFKIRATDRGEYNGGNRKYADSNEIRLVVTPVNDKPYAETADIYVSPADFDGTARNVVWKAAPGKSADEIGGQEVTVIPAEVELTGELAEYLSVSLSVEDGSIVAEYTAHNIGAELVGELLDKEAAFTFKLADNGSPALESPEYTVRIGVVSTPWYPVVEIGCTGHDEHQVVLTSGERTVKLDGITEAVMPADYFSRGIDGLESGSEWAVAIYPVTSEGVDVSVNCAAENTVLKVDEYSMPPIPSVAVTEQDTGCFKFTVTAPMASGYSLELFREGDEEPLFRNEKAFAPGESGYIVPVEVFEKTINHAGTYYCRLTAFNPAGSSDVFTGEKFTTTGAYVPLAEFDDMESFLPAEDAVMRVSDESQNVNFKWQELASAELYLLYVQDISTGELNVYETESAGVTVSLESGGNMTRYSWWVAALDQYGSKVVSGSRVLLLLKNSEIVKIGSVNVSESGNGLVFSFVEESGEMPVKAEIQLAHVNVDGTFTYYSYLGENAVNVSVDGLEGIVSLAGAEVFAGDMVAIKLIGENASGKFTYFTVK